jgi:hypothetical protein
LQAQAKAAASAAQKLPEVTRSLAQAGVPLAAEVSRWIESALPAAAASGSAQLEEARHANSTPSPPPTLEIPETKRRPAPALVRANHRRLKAPKSMSRRRARRF